MEVKNQICLQLYAFQHLDNFEDLWSTAAEILAMLYMYYYYILNYIFVL